MNITGTSYSKRDFEGACTDHFLEYNGYDENPFSYGNEIFIVNRANKDIGFYNFVTDEIGEEISVEFWVHPRACKMALLSIIQAGTIAAYKYGLNNNFKYLYVKVKDPLSARRIMKLMPDVQSHKLSERYTVCFGEIKRVSLLPTLINYDKENHTFAVDL